MRYLIEMKLSSSARSKVPQDGIFLVERYILPSLEICRKWQAEGKLGEWADAGLIAPIEVSDELVNKFFRKS